jgi:hypothetical protein
LTLVTGFQQVHGASRRYIGTHFSPVPVDAGLLNNIIVDFLSFEPQLRLIRKPAICINVYWSRSRASWRLRDYFRLRLSVVSINAVTLIKDGLYGLVGFYYLRGETSQ